MEKLPLINLIQEAWDHRALLQQIKVKDAIQTTIDALDRGDLRIAEPTETGWHIHAWIKKAIVLYFLIRDMEVMETGNLQFYDKIPLKQNYKQLGVRVVPPAVARYGTYLAPGVVLMASYVNIGAYIDTGTMVDIGAAVGSCAQLGKNIHVSAGAAIGGVLEPIQNSPVIIEDGVFIGAKCSIVEGVIIKKEAVLGANVTLTASTKILDVTQPGDPIIYRGYVPAQAIVIPGAYTKAFPAGNYQVPCALIIGKRSTHTDLKLSLNEALRQHDINL
jgi:2,3,4,5-tetrahydropyridine-2-carboxylate N-succinyltransferase